MDLEVFIQRFHAVGSRTTVKTIQKTILGKFVGWEKQTLTVPQQVQARENIGIHLLKKTGQRVYLTRGTHNINFTTAFTDPYVVFPYGSTGAASFLPIITDVSHLNYFTVKMPVDGYLSWTAEVITES